MTFPATITNSWKMGNLKGQRKEKKKQNKTNIYMTSMAKLVNGVNLPALNSDRQQLVIE